MKLQSIIVSVLALLLFGSAHPDPYPDDYFRSPLGIDLYLAGGFAEMRNNHFHAGLDIKTQGQTGYRVYGAADGWVSRVTTLPGGYGNALYVSHPNGFMTVYAHLQSFREDIQEYVKNYQYENNTFRVDIGLNKGDFPVTKGEVIALSGNSGSSAGPHLHFEIRNESNLKPVNPALWGFDIKDSTPPRIFRVKAYALGDGSFIRLRDSKTGGWRRVDAGESAFVDVTRVNGRHVFSRVDRIEASGSIAFGVQTHDYHEGSSNRLGAYRIRLEENGRAVYESTMETIGFSESRYINAHVDYAERRSSGRWVQRSYVLPGNKLPIYETAQNGVIQASDGQILNLEYQVTDVFDNRTDLDFVIHGMSADQPIVPVSGGHSSPFTMKYDETFSWRAQDFAITIPVGTLYQDDVFEYETIPTDRVDLYSDIHVVHHPEVPMHTFMDLEIVEKGLPEPLRSKALVVSVSPKGNLSSAGGSWKDGVVRTRLRAFGRYAIGVDDTPPTIRPLNIAAGKNMSSSSQIRFRIRDNLSGIKRYAGYVDGQWVLFEYDAKNALLTHRFDGRIGPGQHSLEMVVTDNKDNTHRMTLSFSR